VTAKTENEALVGENEALVGENEALVGEILPSELLPNVFKYSK
jgi:hypothetical protein